MLIVCRSHRFCSDGSLFDSAGEFCALDSPHNAQIKLDNRLKVRLR